TKPVEKGVADIPLHQPHRPGIRVREYRFSAEFADYCQPLFGYQLYCLLPGNRDELSASFWAMPEKRRYKTPFGVNSQLVLLHLGAEKPSGVWVIRVAAHSNGFAVFNFYKKAAGVGAVVRARRSVGSHNHQGPPEENIFYIISLNSPFAQQKRPNFVFDHVCGIVHESGGETNGLQGRGVCKGSVAGCIYCGFEWCGFCRSCKGDGKVDSKRVKSFYAADLSGESAPHSLG